MRQEDEVREIEQEVTKCEVRGVEGTEDENPEGEELEG